MLGRQARRQLEAMWDFVTWFNPCVRSIAKGGQRESVWHCLVRPQSRFAGKLYDNMLKLSSLWQLQLNLVILAVCLAIFSSQAHTANAKTRTAWFVLPLQLCYWFTAALPWRHSARHSFGRYTGNALSPGARCIAWGAVRIRADVRICLNSLYMQIAQNCHIAGRRVLYRWNAYLVAVSNL